MAQTATFGRRASQSFTDRLIHFVGRILDINAEIAARNDDSPYFGL